MLETLVFMFFSNERANLTLSFYIPQQTKETYFL